MQWKGWEVVGVVKDVRRSLREWARPCIYGPEGWGPENFNLFVLWLTRECDADFAAALLVTALLACVRPARRAARVDVARLLRTE